MIFRVLFGCSLLLGQVALAQGGSSESPGRIMRIGLQQGKRVTQVTVTGSKGACIIYADGTRKGELANGDGLRIEVAQGGLSARSLSHSFVARRKIELVPVPAGGGFRMRTGEQRSVEQAYPGAFEVTLSNGALLAVNSVDLERYTAGVVQSEAGNYHHSEYYKLQAVTCRTYALTNQRKHKAEGFELCDGVHCQVFHGVARNDSIRMAVEATRGLVLVDAQIKLIHATFHSNCGGETVNAEDLWSKSEPYLRATTDTFCLSAPQARWEKTMSRGEWLGYLERRYGLGAEEGDGMEALLNYEPTCRELYLGNRWPLVPLKNVREDLKLRSTYFSIQSEGDQVRLTGRGFGHGVGLCQEGAMRMARAGRSYTDILHHFYTEVHLVDLSTLDFFREDNAPAGPSAPRSR